MRIQVRQSVRRAVGVAFWLLPTALHAQDASSLLVQARDSIEQGQFEAALALTQRVLDSRPTAALAARIRAHELKGVALLLGERENDAIAAFREVLLLDRSHAVDSLSGLSNQLLRVFALARASLPAVAPPATLEIRGLPSGEVRVMVDDSVWATTRGQIPAGYRHVEIAARGYVTYRDSVLLNAGQTLIKEVALVSAEPARLSVSSEPAGVVYLGGDSLGETPIIDRPVTPGLAMLRIDAPDRPRAAEQRLNLAPGRPANLGTLRLGGPVVPSDPIFSRADSLFRDLQLASALAAYQSVLHGREDSVSAEQRARGATRAAAIHWVLGKSGSADWHLDSARAYARRAFRLAPSYRPDAGEYGSELLALLDSARVPVLALSVQLPQDTTLEPDGRLRVDVTPNRSATVALALVAGDGRLVSVDSIETVDEGLFELPLRTRGGATLPAGRYVLRATAVDALREAAAIVQRILLVNRVPVDTAPSPAPPPTAAFVPETVLTRPGSPVPLLVGGLFAGVAAAAGRTLGNGDLSAGRTPYAGAYVVAGAIGVAGITGFLTGSKWRPSADNIRRNAQLRGDFEQRLAETRRANAAARERAPVRVQVQEPSP